MMDLWFCGLNSWRNPTQQDSVLLLTAFATSKWVRSTRLTAHCYWPMRFPSFHHVFLFQYLGSSLTKYSFKITSRVLFCWGIESSRLGLEFNFSGTSGILCSSKNIFVTQHVDKVVAASSWMDQFYRRIISVCCVFYYFAFLEIFPQVVKNKRVFCEHLQATPCIMLCW